MLPKFLRLSAAMGISLIALLLVLPAHSQTAATALVVSNCGTLPSGTTYSQGQTRTITQDTTGKNCGSGGGGGGGSPGGASGTFQFNSGGSFGGSAGLTTPDSGATAIFADGSLNLSGASSGTATLKAPPTGGGTLTFPAGTDTIVGAAATQTLTNKTISGASNTLNNIATGSLATVQGNGSKVQLSTGSTTTNDCVKFDANGNTVDAGSACGSGGGGSLTLTDGTNTVTGTTQITASPGLVVGGTTPNATLGVTNPDNAYSANHTVAAADMAAQMSLTGSATLTVPAISGTVFASGMTSCYSNNGTGTWTISSTPTISGLPSTSLVPGSGGCLVSNGTSIDYAPGMSLPSSTRLGGVITTSLASHNFATGISSSTGALTGAQPGVSDLSGLGTGVGTALGNNIGSAGAPVTFNGAGGTPSSLTLTNATGLVPSTGTTATGTPSSTTYLRGDNTWSAVSGTSGGGMFNYSDNGVTVTANTYYAPAGGGGAPQTTESAVDIASPSATTVTNLQVGISATLGGLSTGFTVTLRKNNADTALTCTFNPSSLTSCSDLTHSVTIAQNDIIDWKIVTTGTITGTPTVTIFANNGTSNVGVTSITCNGGLSGGTITTTGTCSLNLSNANVWNAQQSNCITTLSISGSTFTPDGSCNNYKIVLVHASCPCTLANFSTTTGGAAGVIEVDQSASGSDTISTYGSQLIAPGGTSSLTYSSGASAKDFISYLNLDSTHTLLTMAGLNATH